jgi:hypothetical protein
MLGDGLERARTFAGTGVPSIKELGPGSAVAIGVDAGRRAKRLPAARGPW